MAVQTCDQAITFRNFNYARALEVVQDEEYLDDVDFDEIRLRRKQGEVFQAIDNFNEKIENNFIQTDDFSEDSAIFHREKRGGCCQPVVQPNLTITTHPWEICAKVLVGVGILIALNPPPPLTPPTSPRCGEPGGGGCPDDNNPGNILDLVPDGLTPVATFPPFKNPFRNVDAVAAIFKEPPCTFGGENTGGEGFEPFRRSSGYSRQPSLLDRFRKNIRCLGPRLAARFGNEPATVVNCGIGKKKRDTGYGYHVQEECGTIEDCFDQPCPRFGIAVKATFTRRTPSYDSGYGLTERQTGESFKSAAPPDCRVTG